MRNKDYLIFAAVAYGLILAIGIPRLLIVLGFVSDHLSAYTADESGVLYVATDRQVHIIDRDGHETKLTAPFEATSIRSLDEETLLLRKNSHAVLIRKDGAILSSDADTGDINDTDNLAKPLSVGDSVYRVRTVLGRYTIEEKRQEETMTRYQMPLSDYLVLLYEILCFLSAFPVCAFLPIYYYKTGRIAKNGKILPPQGSRQ